MWFICWELPFLIEFAGGFIMLSRGEEECCDQSIIIGDIPAIRSSPKHSRWLTEWEWPHSYLRRPWKTKKFLFQSPNFDHRNWAKINTSLCCSNFAVVDHAVYSLWVGWCLFKSGILPLTLHKFIKSVSFSTFIRKTSRWAKSVPTAGEKHLLITLRTKIQVMVPRSPPPPPPHSTFDSRIHAVFWQNSRGHAC